MWTPDVYEGAPTPVVGFFAGAPKLAAMVLFARLLTDAFPGATEQWRQVLIVIALLSVCVGAFAGLAQNNLKRLWAYSSIANIGYALVGLAAGGEAGVQSMLVFMVLYIIDVTGFFACLAALSRDGRPMETFDDFAGLMRERPGLALAMTAFCPLGARPAAVLAASGASSTSSRRRSAPASTTWVAVVALVGSVVAAFYYLRLIKVMWLDPPPGAARRRRRRRHGRRRLRHRPLRAAGRPGRADLARSLVGDRGGVRPLSALARPAALPPIEALEEINSTNAEARRRAEAGAAGPLWITAQRQTAGRGRRGRSWETGAGNLAATYLLMTAKPPAEAAQVSFVAALAVADLAGAYVPASLVSLKWPNDPLIAGRKAAGILVESGPHPDGGLWLAIGCGVNLATPPESRRTPGHRLRRAHAQPAADAAGGAGGPGGRLRALARRLGAARLRRRSPRPGPSAPTASARPAPPGCPPRRSTGVAEGLDPDGALRLRTARRPACAASPPATSSSERPDRCCWPSSRATPTRSSPCTTARRWIAQWRAATEAARTADEYAVWLSQLLAMAGLSLGQLDACIISSVVPQSLFNLRNLARRYLHVEPLVVGENVELGIEVRIDEALRGRRRPAGQRHRRPRRLPGRPAGDRLRHRHHLRRRRRRRRVRGRRDRARHQPLHAGAARRGRPAAAGRHPPASRQPRGRQRHGRAPCSRASSGATSR